MTQQPPRCKAVKPEEVVEGSWYTFTYNPKDQPLLTPRNVKTPFKDPFQVWFKDTFLNLFKSLRNCCIQCRLEISSGGRFHVHGRVRIDNIPLFYAVDIKRLQALGSYEIDIMTDPDVWDMYCRKQQHIMIPFLRDEEIPKVLESHDTAISLLQYQSILFSKYSI